MAKNRYVNTKMWRDDYFSDLDPSEKLLFVYCLTNPDTNLCGIYEVPIKIMATDTGLDRDMILKILERFEKDGKVLYREGWLAIKNFMKYQKFNPSIETAIKNELGVSPDYLRKWTECIQPVDSLLSGCGQDKLSKNIDKSKNKQGNKLNINNKRFIPPRLEEVKKYIIEKKYPVDPDKWWNFYEAKGWMIGKNKMKNWHRAISTWLPEGWKAEKEKSTMGNKKMDKFYQDYKKKEGIK